MRDKLTTGCGPLSAGAETLESIGSMADKYQAEWQLGGAPELALFLPTVGTPQRRPALVRLVAIDLDERIGRGEAARLEQYLDRFSELGGVAELPAELIAAEYAARSAAGVAPSIDEYARRFPAQIDQLKDAWLDNPNPPTTARDPGLIDLAPGTQIGDFEIVRLLGKGGFARVYLARQLSLDRPVALKVSRARGDEGKTLAQFDHPHIVPVFSEQVIEDRKLLAMRYVPGKTLAHWMVERGELDLRRWRGSDLLDWIRKQADAPAASVLPPSRDGIVARRFAACACHLMRDVAGALDHAHQRGVLHCDVKPANILLDLDGHALLMDFNVATRTAEWCATARQRVGGTLPYMAPEQLAAFLPDACHETPGIDARCDIYALGVVFYELLAGQHPWPPPQTNGSTVAIARAMLAARLQGAPPLPPTVATPGLRSIVHTCLAPQADDRYTSAAELAGDLERWLDGRPLAVAADRNVLERAGKSLRRHALAAAVLATVALVVVVALTLLVWSDRSRLGNAQRMLTQADAVLTAGDRSTARTWVEAAERAIARTGVLPLPSTWARRATVQQSITTLAQRIATAELRDFEILADRARVPGASLPQPPDPAVDPLRVYRVLQQPDWETRLAFRGLPSEDRLRLSEDITELLLVRTIAKFDSRQQISAPRQISKSRPTTLDLLDRLPSIHERLPLVAELRRSLRNESGTAAPTGALARTADSDLTHYLVGVIAAQRSEFQLAVTQFDLSKANQPVGRPDRFWRRFLHAYCCARLERDQEAIAGYGICIGLKPDFAWPYNNLGLIYTRQGAFELAAKEFAQALRCAPKLAVAHANMGVAWFQMDRFDDAQAAFSRALELGGDTAEVRANRAAARAALGDRQGARADLQRALATDPTSAAALENLRRLDAAR